MAESVGSSDEKNCGNKRCLSVPERQFGGGGRTDGVCYAIEGNTVDRASNKNGRGWCENISPTLNTQDRHAVVFRKVCKPGSDGKCYTLNTIERHAVCYSVDGRNNRITPEVSGTLQAHMDGGWSINCTHPVLYENEKE